MTSKWHSYFSSTFLILPRTSEKSAGLSGFIFFETLSTVSYPLLAKCFFKTLNVAPFQRRKVQNRIPFCLQFSASVPRMPQSPLQVWNPQRVCPRISRSQFSTTDGSEVAMSKAGAFVKSEIASARRLVFPVLEKYSTQGFIICYFNSSLYIIFVGLTWKKDSQ